MGALFQGILQKLTWVYVILILGCAGAYFYATLDQTELEQLEQAIDGEKKNIAGLEAKIEQAKEFERQFEEKKKQYAELVKTLQGLKEALPRQFLMPDLLSDLQHEASDLELEITSVAPDASEQQEELYNSIGFVIKVQATFPQIFVFLDRMAHTARLLNVETIKLSRDTNNENKGKKMLGGDGGAFSDQKFTGGNQWVSTLTAEFRVLTYRYRGAPTAPPAPASAGKGKK